jgi:hypothetical protein
MSSKKRDTRQATFDFSDDPVEPIVESAPVRVWQEVPQTLFLSWSRSRQLGYCIRRDEDSAVVDSDNRDFYLQRAADYRRML